MRLSFLFTATTAALLFLVTEEADAQRPQASSITPNGTVTQSFSDGSERVYRPGRGNIYDRTPWDNRFRPRPEPRPWNGRPGWENGRRPGGWDGGSRWDSRRRPYYPSSRPGVYPQRPSQRPGLWIPF